jgi:hypothetical protein
LNKSACNFREGDTDCGGNMYTDFILRDKLNIYNNRAISGESSGRLSVIYNIYPAPAIFWEFETENKAIDLPKYDANRKLISPFECNSYSMESPFLYPTDEFEKYLSGGKRITGSTAKAIVGDPSISGRTFTFSLPNARFQEVGMRGKFFWVKEISYMKPKTAAEVRERFHEGYLEVIINNGMTLKTHTPIESIRWLKSPRSTGTYLTTWGELSVDKDIAIDDAVKLLDDLSSLLSFANGGWIAPLVVKMDQRDFEREYPTVYTAFVVDPIEHVADTWLNRNSDIGNLCKCFPSFQKMLQSDQWKENFWLILMWYFQAIQPLGIQLGGKPWPVVANAIGAALEKLASIVLVEEKKCVTKEGFYGNHRDKRGLYLEDKIRKLLKTIGIDNTIPTYNGHDAIWWFKEMRNDATHPKSNHEWTGEEVNVILGNAIQWVEETLLWRIGYRGGYSDRSRENGFFLSPRYEIELCDDIW